MPAIEQPSAAGQRVVRVWDLPTRLFHWGLAALIATSLVTVKLGGGWMEWHFVSGYAALVLLLFRLMWGFAGSRYARFSSFVFGPKAVMAHVRGATDAPRTLGHNPLGSLSVWALLGLVAAQAASGLFATDEIAYEGPLASAVSEQASLAATQWHKLSEPMLYTLIGLHVAAILYYWLRRGENLVRPMLTGDKQVEADWPAARDDRALRLRALSLLAVAAAAVWLLLMAAASA